MRNLAGVCALVAAFAPGAAQAADSISCTGVGRDDVALELTLGSLPVLQPVGAFVAVGDRHFAFGVPEAATPLVVGQAYGEGGLTAIDFTDPNVETIVVSVRLWRAEEADTTATAGVLRVADIGAFAITCEGP